MFKTIEEYKTRLELLRAEKEGYLKAADDVDNNIKLLEAERDSLAKSIKANEEFATCAKECVRQIKILVDSFKAEGFDEETAKKITLTIIGVYWNTDPITINSIVSAFGGL